MVTLRLQRAVDAWQPKRLRHGWQHKGKTELRMETNKQYGAPDGKTLVATTHGYHPSG